MVRVLALRDRGDVRLEVWIRARGQQRLHHVQVTFGGRPHERGLFLIRIRGVDERATRKQ